MAPRKPGRSPGEVRRDARHLPRAASPGTERYSVQGDVERLLDRHYSVFFARTGSCAEPPSSLHLRYSRWQMVFAGCCEPLLESGPSRRYLHNPCMSAWTPTPPRSAGAYTRFFPADIGLTPV